MERTVVEPMTATSSRMHVTVSREFLALLKKAKAGDAHRNPGASDEEVLTAALHLLIEKQGKRKACVPARVKREVVKRDEGKCQWKMADGGVCGATVRLEVDHVVPRGRGGPSTVENCRILCRSHNLKPPARPTATRTWTCSPVVDLPATLRWPGRTSRPTGRVRRRKAAATGEPEWVAGDRVIAGIAGADTQN